jgi:4-oxalocrotonate tautomerase
MPVLTLKTNALQDDAQKLALARALTRLTACTLGKQVGVTAVLVESLPIGNWVVGLEQAPHTTALLEICITAGTNTAEQKAEFIAASWALLKEQLPEGAALTEASYVIVREIPSTDWGYGGRTQQARKANPTGV